MKYVWTSRQINASPETVWRLLVDPAVWPAWGPSVRSATVDGGDLGPAATGTVETVVGLHLPFEITHFEPGRRWSWSIAGIGATDHVVEPIDGGCRVSFGTPWPAAAYLPICRWALTRLARLAAGPIQVSTEAPAFDAAITETGTRP